MSLRMKLVAGVSSLLIFLFVQPSASVLQCDAFFSLPTTSSCRISSGSVEDNEDLIISNTGQSVSLLSFSDVSFNAIPKDLFTLFPNVKTLYISHNNMSRLIAADLKNCQKLTTLFIYDNQLSTLDPQTLQQCSNLLSLSLSENPITSLAPGVFAGLSKLQSLTLANLPLTNFDSAILSDLPQLRDLKIINCSLTAIDRSFTASNRNLTTVHLETNQIETVEDGAFDNLPNLQWLSFDSNRIKSLSTFNAETFTAESNLLQHLHITALTETVTVDNNFLTSVTCDSTLKVLSLAASNNSLTRIPCLAKMTSAYGIYLENNNLSALKATLFKNLHNVTVLRIFNNPKLKIGSKMLSSMASLRELCIGSLANGYKNLHAELPKLWMISLTTKNWTCAKLKNVANVLNAQKIYLNYNKVDELATFKCPVSNWNVSHFDNNA